MKAVVDAPNENTLARPAGLGTVHRVCLTRLPWLARVSTALLGIGCVPALLAQTEVDQVRQTIGNRVESLVILGGDHAVGGGAYAFRGSADADLSIAKIGGGGMVAPRRALGIGHLQWAPVLEGNIGWASTENRLGSGPLVGNNVDYQTFAFELGGGARFFLTTNFSLGLSVAGIYAHTENEFEVRNQAGADFKATPLGQSLLDWDVDTWSVVPAAGLSYTWQWHRTVFQLDSRFRYFHTESFDGTSQFIEISGNSQTWENRLDVDIPTGWFPLKHEFRTGGYFSRTELFGSLSDGLNEEHIYKINARSVLDFTGALWKVRWLGMGGSYFWGKNFSGWSAGVNVRFKF
jgi:hypothetical protein